MISISTECAYVSAPFPVQPPTVTRAESFAFTWSASAPALSAIAIQRVTTASRSFGLAVATTWSESRCVRVPWPA